MHELRGSAGPVKATVLEAAASSRDSVTIYVLMIVGLVVSCRVKWLRSRSQVVRGGYNFGLGWVCGSSLDMLEISLRALYIISYLE